MNESTLENVCKAILKRLTNQQSIRDEQVRLLKNEISKRIENADLEELPESYHQLQQHLQRAWQYNKIDDLSAEDAITFGALYAICSMAETSRNRQKEDFLLDEAARQHRKHLLFFQTLQQNPGIKHGDLAKKCNKSPSELSQLVARLQWERYFSFSKAGREKYYYLEKRGEELLHEMKMNSTAVNKFDWLYNIKHEKQQIELWKNRYFMDRFIQPFYETSGLSERMHSEKGFSIRKVQTIDDKRYKIELDITMLQGDYVKIKEEEPLCKKDLRKLKALG